MSKFKGWLHGICILSIAIGTIWCAVFLMAIAVEWVECRKAINRLEQSEAAFADRYQNQELHRINKKLNRLIFSYTSELEKDGH